MSRTVGGFVLALSISSACMAQQAPPAGGAPMQAKVLAEFKKMFKTATEDPHEFLMVDLRAEVPQLKYRKGLDTYFIRD